MFFEGKMNFYCLSRGVRLSLKYLFLIYNQAMKLCYSLTPVVLIEPWRIVIKCLIYKCRKKTYCICHVPCVKNILLSGHNRYICTNNFL